MADKSEQTVKIPLALLNQTIELLGNINLCTVPNYDQSVVNDYENVLSSLRKKKRSLDLRQTYAKIIFAENDDQRFSARMRYLQEKRQINDEY